MHKTSTSFHFEEFYYSVRGQFFVLLDKIVSEQWEYTGMNIQEFFVEWPIFDFCLSKIGTIKQNKNRSWRENLSVGIDMPKLGVFENVIVVIKFFLEVVELAPVTPKHLLEIRKKNFFGSKFYDFVVFFRNSSINTRPQATPRTRHSSNERACFILLESSYKKLRKVTGWSKKRFESR